MTRDSIPPVSECVCVSVNVCVLLFEIFFFTVSRFLEFPTMPLQSIQYS